MGQATRHQADAEEAPRGRVPADSALIRRSLAGAAVFAAAAVALGCLLLPIVAIFARVSPGTLLAQLSRPVVTDALLVSLKANVIAQALVLLFGTPLAYVLATRRFPGRSLGIVLVELPLVLPPAVAGIGLIAAFGRLGLLGGTLDALGIRLGLTQAAVVIAVAYVSSPFYIRQAIAVFEGVDQDLVAAARTLGAGRGRTFFRVVLPLARRGLAAGEALAFARGLGEFGATIMFAGALQRVTETLPVAIYLEFAVNFNTALAMSAVLVIVSGALLVALRITLQWQPSRPTSRFLFAPSR
jgi:molybdate transport system permease protein